MMLGTGQVTVAGPKVRGRSSWRAALACALCLAAAAALPAHALASVAIGPEQIVVEGSGASAVIQRAPFGMAFRDSAQNTVLSEVPASGEKLALPPAGPGTRQPSGPSLYAPLAFLVGEDALATFTSGQDGGDLFSSSETGTEYSAQEVLSAAPEGEGVRLTLSTNDPSGRELQLSVTPQGAGAIRVSAAPSEPSGVVAMSDSFSSSSTEAFHGFGGRHNSLDQHGGAFYNWVDQENFEKGSPETLEPNGAQAAYYVQSSFVSNAGYGFLLDRPELSGWRMDSDLPDAWQTQVQAPGIDYVVAPGGMAQAASTLTSITGRQRVPPSWAVGPIFDREGEYGVSPASYEAQVQSDLQNIVHYKLPIQAYRIEDWQYLSTSSLEGVISQLHALGIHPLVYFRPFVGEEQIGQEEPAAFSEAVTDGYVARTAGGQPYIYNDNFGKPAALIDFTNPAAVAWWKGRIDRALELGVDGFMLDFGEQVLPGMHFSDGSEGTQMHNRYPVIYDQVTREIVEEFEALHPGRSIFFFTRSGYTGDPGSAAYESANFPGMRRPTGAPPRGWPR